MGQEKSADQVLADYVAAMGPELGRIFYAASSELTWTHWKWKQHRILFSEKQSRIDLMNRSAPLFFQIVNKVIFEDTLLAIARLCGPAASRNKPNLSVERFPSLLRDQSLKREVRQLIKAARKSATFALDWRNRRIAHRDLDLIIKSGVRPLETASGVKVDAALEALRKVLNRIEMAYCNAATYYDSSPSHSDARLLLYVIRDGLLHAKERHDRLAGGADVAR